MPKTATKLSDREQRADWSHDAQVAVQEASYLCCSIAESLGSDGVNTPCSTEWDKLSHDLQDLCTRIDRLAR
jgi:hypothetical protein